MIRSKAKNPVKSRAHREMNSINNRQLLSPNLITSVDLYNLNANQQKSGYKTLIDNTKTLNGPGQAAGLPPNLQTNYN